MEVLDDRRKPTVIVKWDPMPDVAGGDEYTESVQVLLPSRWNKDCNQVWRMDVFVDVGEELDNEDGKYEGSSDESELDFGSSESELDFGSSNNNSK